MVMARGRAVQVGSADDLFERPAHTFVGHFIGSPGMNFLPAQWREGGLMVGQARVDGASGELAAKLEGAGPVKLGVRPEYLRVTEPGAAGAVPMRVERVQDVGTYTLLVADFEGTAVRARLGSNIVPVAAGGTVWLSVLNPHTCFYRDEVLIP
jgi:glycerol transport system ATP-binding protein